MNDRNTRPTHDYNEPEKPSYPKKKEPETKRSLCSQRDEEGYCKYKPDGKKFRCKGISFESCDVFLKIKNGRIILDG